MRIDVSADTSGDALRALAPVVEEIATEQETSILRSKTRLVAGGAFPDAQIVADERLVRFRTEKLPGDQAVLFVHAGIDFRIDFDEGGLEGVPAHVFSD